MNSPIIVWFRADLRVHDHPALAAAVRNGESVVPVFIFNDALTKGEFSGANRNRFLLECLADLKHSLKKRGADLVIREGDAATVLKDVAGETGAQRVYYTVEYTPWSLKRDKVVTDELSMHSIEARAFGGKLAVNSLQKITTKNGSPFKVFTPFWRSWSSVQRREVVEAPRTITMPSVRIGSLPSLASLADEVHLSKDALKGGETEARERLKKFLDTGIATYHTANNDMAADGTSRLSAYLHFGCLSVREIETMLPDSEGARAWHRQLAWREFYYYVIFHFPHPRQEFQERYRDMPWQSHESLLEAWKDGATGYPVVDAAMRQLRMEGWMHNRARLIVGSFLTKDLGIDWREGEKHFMHWLIDGDMANNNGNWQWIASVGVDPAPVFRRLYNPSTQRDRYDESGQYVRRYVPELAHVPDKHLSEPWLMTDEEQQDAGVKIGTDYPAPIVDHKEARQRALERYRR
jgi:deoxyribodipyrimidine photo-lyase